MTEFEALKKTAAVWQWLAEHPGKTKGDAYQALNLSLDRDLCALCAYARQEKSPEEYCTGNYCSECLLKGLWPEGCCGSENSPYHIWATDADQKKVTQAAWDITNYTFHLIDELQRGLSRS